MSVMRAVLATTVLLGGCVSGVLELGPGQDAETRPDGGIADTGLADAKVADAEVAVDVGSIEDAGIQRACRGNWTTLATSIGERLRSGSFAAVPGAFALIWSEISDEWVETTYLRFFDASATLVGSTLTVDPGSQIIAVGDRFLRGGRDGIQWFEADGTPGVLIEVAPFFPSAFVGGRIFGRVPADASGPQPAMLINDSTQVEILWIPLSLEASMVFGPDRFIVVDNNHSGATVRAFVIENKTPSLIAEHVMTSETLDGEEWRPTNLAAGSWNGDLNQFELLFAINHNNGRFYGAKLFAHRGTELIEGTPLPDQLAPITHGRLDGDVSVSAGSPIVAYQNNSPAFETQLLLVFGGAVLRFDDFTTRLESRPLLAPIDGGVALVSTYASGQNGQFEDEVRIRCELF